LKGEPVRRKTLAKIVKQLHAVDTSKRDVAQTRGSAMQEAVRRV